MTNRKTSDKHAALRRTVRVLSALILTAAFCLALLPLNAAALFRTVEEAACIVAEPVPGAHPSFSAQSGSPDRYTVEVESWSYCRWTPDGGEWVKMTESDVFEEGTLYTLRLQFTPKGENTFESEETRYFINGAPALTEWGREMDAYGRVLGKPQMDFYCRSGDPSEPSDPSSQAEPASDLWKSGTAYTRTATVMNPDGVAVYVKPDSTGQIWRYLPYGQILEIAGTEKEFTLVNYRWSEGGEIRTQVLYVPTEELRENVIPTAPGIRREKWYPEYVWGLGVSEWTNVRLAPYPDSQIAAHPINAGTEVLILQEYRGFSLVWYAYEDGKSGACSTFGWVPAASLFRGTAEEYLAQLRVNPSLIAADSLYYVTHADEAVVYSDYREKTFAGKRERGTVFRTPKDELYYSDIGEAFLRMEYGLYISLEDVQEWKTELYPYGQLAVIIDERAWIYQQPSFVRGSATLGRYQTGDVVTYYAVQNGYLMVCHEGKVGWIPEFATHRGKYYDYRLPEAYPPQFLAAPAFEFEKQAPVYLAASEDENLLAGYIYDGYYTYQGESQGFYKIEYRGEAGFVPKRFCLTDYDSPDRRTVSLYSHEWGGSPLLNGLCDRLYVAAGEARIFSFSDPGKQIGSVPEGTELYGSADCTGVLKKVRNPLAGGEEYAYVEVKSVHLSLPEAVMNALIKRVDTIPLLSATVGFKSGESFTIPAENLDGVSVRSMNWTLRNGKGDDVTGVFATTVKSDPSGFTCIRIDLPDATLDGGVAELRLETSDGRKACRFYYLAMGSDEIPIPSLNVNPGEGQSYEIHSPADSGSGKGLTCSFAADAAGQIAIGGNIYDVTLTSFTAVASEGYGFGNITASGITFENFSGGQYKIIGLQNLPGAVTGTILKLNAAKVSVTSGPSASMQVVLPSATDRGSAVITVSATGQNAAGADWYAVGKTPEGETSFTRILSGEKFTVTSSSGSYSCSATIPGSAVRADLDPGTGESTLTLRFDDYGDWAEMPVDDLFFCVFRGETSLAVTDFVRLPDSEGDGEPVTE
ncbi:MAG: hypothetical protein ILO68_05535, partial [Clostridia bacterium]|nr:hypothetical protein [Clostridia bacterium]